ncbi:MAG: hypothetical protein AAFQ12_00945 [Pseudomonadota bacterium]
MKAFLTNGKTIVFLGLAFLALTLGFGAWIQAYDLHIIDEISDPDQIRAVVGAMTPEQRSAHWWMTLVLDYFYPLAYGGFFAGMALRFFGKAGPLLALPAFICIPADVIENTVQLFILSGDESLIWLKAIMTPLKLATFIPAALIALVGLGIALYRRFLRKDSAPIA